MAGFPWDTGGEGWRQARTVYHAARDDLIRLVLAQQDELAARDRRLTAVERQLAAVQATIARLTDQLGAPGRDKSPRRKRAQNHARHRLTPTARVEHALERCPDCGAPLAGGTVKRMREVLEFPAPTIEVIEHVYLERRCPDCGKCRVPGPDLTGVIMGRSRLGNRLVSLLAVLREEARLPFATMQSMLGTVYGLELSVGAIVGAVQRVATHGQAVMETLQEAIRASPVLHVDETGWRDDGHNGDVWTFSTPTARLFVRDTREKRVLAEMLGETFAGVLVSDFYGAYTRNGGRHQFCWAHLLRDVHDLTATSPADARVQGWAAQVQATFAQAQAAIPADAATRRRVAAQVRTDLTACCAPWLPTASDPPDPPVEAAHRRLCQQITRHLPDLLTFLTEEGVPATNNAAERSLRPLVISRKISGGTRSATGSDTKLTLASLFGTWRLRGINPFTACQARSLPHKPE